MSETETPRIAASNLPEVEVIYVGDMLLADGKSACALLPTGMLGVDDSAFSLFTFKRGTESPSVVGGVYKIKGDVKDGKLDRIAGRATYTGSRVEDVAKVVAWETAHRAQRIVRRSKKLEKDDASKLMLRAALDPIRRAYQKTDWSGRLAFEVLVLNELRTHRRGDQP